MLRCLLLGLIALLLPVSPALGLTSMPTASGESGPDTGAVQVSPAPGAQLSWSPKLVTLTFPESVSVGEVDLELRDDEGYGYPPAAPTESEGVTLRFATPQLPNGNYTLTWSGRFTGSSSFSVNVNGSSASLSPSAGPGSSSPTDATDPQTQTTGEGFPLLAGVALLVPVVGLTWLLLRRNRRLAIGFVVLSLLAGAGSLLVLEQDSTSADSRLRCLGLEGDPRLECLTAAVIAAYDAAGVSAATAELHALEQDRRFVSAYGENVCHTVAHMSARVVVAREGSLTKVADGADLLCASGFLHGALEGGAPLLTNEIFSREVTGLCGGGSETVALECAHGVGHGAALRFNSRLFESADLCLALANEAQVTQCLLGVAMLSGNWIGNMVARDPSPEGFTPPGVPLGQIGEPCLDERFTSVADRFRACLEGVFFYLKAGEQVTARLPAPWNSVDTIAGWCVDVVAERPELEPACFSGLGSASALRLERSPAELPGVCSRAPGETGLLACVESLVTQVRNNRDVSPPREVFEEICSLVPEVAKERCSLVSDRLINR